MAKLASQAVLCYNGDLKYRGSEGAVNTFRLVTHLLWRQVTVNTLSPHAQDGNIPLKRCPACPDPEENHWHPATTAYFYSRKTSKDGLDYRCKQCAHKTAKAYRSHMPLEVRLRAQERRRLPEVRAQEHAQQKVKRSRPEYHAYHIARMKVYRERPEIQARRWAYHRLPEVQERARLSALAYDHSPQGRAHKRAYGQRPEVHAMRLVTTRNRRARIKAASGTHTPEQLRKQYDRQKGKCYYCQKSVKWGKHHVDHVIPLSRGGSNDISNLVITCPTCNWSKHDRLPHEWPKGGRLL